MSLNPLDQALAGGGGGKSFFTKTSVVGDTITGTIIDATLQQTRDYLTGDPETWDDGNPKQQVAVKVQTDIREDQDDDGVRGVYIKTWGAQRDALQEAIKTAGASKASDVLNPGAGFTASFVGSRPSQKGSDEKLYAYRITPAPAAALDGALPAPQAAPAAQAVPQTAAPVPAPAPVVPQPAATVTAPAPAPAAPAGESPADKAKQLLALGLDDNTIATATGLDPSVVAILRNA